jgi:hypothetical protein
MTKLFSFLFSFIFLASFAHRLSVWVLKFALPSLSSSLFRFRLGGFFEFGFRFGPLGILSNSVWRRTQNRKWRSRIMTASFMTYEAFLRLYIWRYRETYLRRGHVPSL